ncbi:MAG: DUF2029 domain-containing protein [Phycisphaerae bacterium]|nr:DUF2029 domain-containing protein [Phycisphaerae bacterium]
MSGTLASTLHRIGHDSGDFNQFRRDGALAIESGRLGPHLPLAYPPTARPLFMLMALPPPKLAAAVWWLIQIGLYWQSAVWLARRAFDDRRSRLIGPMLVLAVGFVGIVSDLSVGQLTALIVFGCAAAFESAERGRPIRAGVALAVTLLVKPLPIVLLPYFVWRRKGRVPLCAAAAWLILGPGLLSILFGWQSQLDGWRHFRADTAGPRAPWNYFTDWQDRDGQMNTYRESGLASSLVRLLRPVPYDRAGGRVQIATLPAGVLLAIWLAITGAVTCVIAHRAIRATRSITTTAHIFAALVGVMMLANPKLISYWHAAAIIPGATLLGTVWRGRTHDGVTAPRLCWIAVAALAAWLASMILFALPAARAAGSDAMGWLVLALGAALASAPKPEPPRTAPPRDPGIATPPPPR